MGKYNQKLMKLGLHLVFFFKKQKVFKIVRIPLFGRVCGLFVLFFSITLFQNCNGNFQVKSQPNSALSSLSASAPQCTFNGLTYTTGQQVTAYLASTVAFGQTCQSKVQTCQANGSWDGSYAYSSCSVGAAASCLFNGQTIADGQSVTAYQNSSVAFGGICTSQSRVCSNGTLSGSYAYASCSTGAAASCLFNGQTIQNAQSVTAYQNSSVAYGSTCTSETRACSNGTLSGSFAYASCSVASAASCLFNGQTVADGQSVQAYQNSSVAYGNTCTVQTRTCSNGTLSGAFAYASCSVSAAVSCLFNGQTVADGQSVTAYQNSSVAYGSSCVSQSRTCTTGTLSGSYNYASCTTDAPASCLFNGQTIANGQTVTAYLNSTVPYGNSCSDSSQVRQCNNGMLSGTYSYSSCAVDSPASCLFNGQTIANGQSVSAYQASSVAYGQSCVMQSRSCVNGTLSGSYTYSSCTVNAPASCTFNGQTIANGESVTGYQNSSVAYGSVCMSNSLYCDNGVLSGADGYPYASCTVNGPASCLFNGQTVPSGQSVTGYQATSVPYGQACNSFPVMCSNGVLIGGTQYPYSSCSVQSPISCTFNGTTVPNGSSVTGYDKQIYSTGCGWGNSDSVTCNNGVMTSGLGGSYPYPDCGSRYTHYNISFTGATKMALYEAFTSSTTLAQCTYVANSMRCSGSCSAKFTCPNSKNITVTYTSEAESGYFPQYDILSAITVFDLADITNGATYSSCYRATTLMSVPGKEYCPGMNQQWGDSSNPDPNMDAEINALSSSMVNYMTTGPLFPQNPLFPVH